MTILRNFKKRMKDLNDNPDERGYGLVKGQIASKASTAVKLQALVVVRRSRRSLPSFIDWLCFLAPLFRSNGTKNFDGLLFYDRKGRLNKYL